MKQASSMVYREGVEAPCVKVCPAGVDIPRCNRLIADGKFGEALAVIREKIPFPSVCGRVCPSPCEAKCQLSEVDEAMMIRALKRFVAERDTGLWRQASKIGKPTGRRVAIIGSGPGGLTAAYYLAKLGHGVTVFEALPQPGGMMRVGIPEYRLPRGVLDAEIDAIRGIGVDIKTNTRIDSPDGLFGQGHDAVFVAVGAHKPMKMGVEGEDGPGVVESLSLLRQVNQGQKVSLGNRVAVVGGGNSAIDAARVALRLDAKEVTIIYRRTQAEMPANPAEIEEALKEGVTIQFLAAPTGITRDNGAVKMECIRMKLGGLDESGRPRPEPIAGSEFSMSFDMAISAIGQVPDIPAQFGLAISERGTLEADPDTLTTSREGVFAGGDATSGPASVIEAIAAGRRAAISIDRYLGGSGVIDEKLVPHDEIAPLEPWVPVGERAMIPSLPIAERLAGFAEVELSLSEELAVEQAKRCLRCDLPIIADPAKCCGCLICELRCSLRLEGAFNPSKARIKIRRLVKADTEYMVSFTDECDNCGICARYCPYGTLSRERKEVA
ncbi:MAG: FAD-dependent oxidoreductase [Dehalococcoidia bacterium]|nr:FAD-dependent oxidoreductase [Dehalococcoidia bacterium]